MRIVQDTTFTSTTEVPLTFTIDQAKRYHFALKLASGTDGDVFASLQLTDSAEGGGDNFGFEVVESDTATTAASQMLIASARNYSPAWGWATLYPRFEGAAIFSGLARSPQSTEAKGYVAALVTGLSNVNYDGGTISLNLARSGRLVVYEERMTT